MTKHRLFAALFAIMVSPWIVTAQGNGNAYGRDKTNDAKPVKVEKEKDKEVTDKSVPAPPVLVLLAAGAGVAGVASWRRRRQSA